MPSYLPLKKPFFAPFMAAYEPPSARLTDAPRVCLTINTDWAAFAAGALISLLVDERWLGDELTRQFAEGQVNALLYAIYHGNVECEGEIDMRIRQQVTNPCILEVSYDSGATWETGFDFSQCLAESTGGNPAPSVAVQTQINLVINNVLNAYDGTPASVAPDMVHNGDGKNDERDSAACAGVYQVLVFLRSLAIQKPKHHTGWVWDWWRLLDDLANVAFDVLWWVGDYLIPDWTIMDELLVDTGRRIQKEIGAFLEGYDITPLQDENVIMALLCYAYGTIDGATVTFNEFSHMFDNCATLPGVTGSVEDFLVKLVDDEEYYATFLASVNDFVNALAAGSIIYDCPCDEWVKIWPFVDGAGGWLPYVHGNLWTDPDPPPKGIHQPPPASPPGWYTEAYGPTARHLTIHRPLGGQYDVTYLKATFAQTGGGKQSYQSNISLGLAEWGEYKALTENSGAITLEWSGVPTPATCLIFETSFNGASDTVLTALEVRGIGTEPVW